MKHIFLLAAICLISVSTVAAKAPYKGAIEVRVLKSEKQDGKLLMDAVIDFGALDLPTTNMVTITPVLRSLDGLHEHRFAPVIIAGRNRDKIIRMEMKFGDFAFDAEPQAFMKRNPGRSQTAALNLQVPYETWMRRCELLFLETVTACNCIQVGHMGYKTYRGILMDLPEELPFVPRFEVSYLTPPAVEVKTFTENYTARLEFPAGSSMLVRDFRNNAAELAKVDQVVGEIKNNPDLTISEIKVTGYASPEGDAVRNLTLSQERARTFMTYLHWKHNLYRFDGVADYAGMGEDWDGLRKAVADASCLPEGEQVLAAIDHIYNPESRKAAIKALDRGRTYRILANDYFPALRRNEFTVSYVAKHFSVEEAKALIHTKPQLLSLNEMYQIANTYPKGSPDFREVYDVASRIYPEDPVSQFNTAALELESGATDRAIGRLGKLENRVNAGTWAIPADMIPELYNNLGVACFYKKEYDRAESWFKQAAAAGNRPALHNLDQFDNWKSEAE